MELLVVGTSHRVAPAGARDRAAASAGDAAAWVSRVAASHPSIAEALVLATCHRLELYVTSTDPQGAARALSALIDTGPELAASGDAGRFLHVGAEAATHLCRVACGLDSMIVGEAEIAGQVRRAAVAAREAGGLRGQMEKVVAGALAASGRARSETRIAHGVMSASSAAVALAGHRLGGLDGRTVMVIGAGEAGRLALARLARRPAIRRLVASRSVHHAEQAAAAYAASAVPFAGIGAAIRDVDAVIAAVQAPAVIVTAAMCGEAMEGRADRPLVVIDLSVPRAVAADVNAVDGVSAFTMDDLGDIARQSAERRAREIPAVEAIAADEGRRAWARAQPRARRG